MKRIWMLIVVFYTIGYVYGQDEGNHYFGVYYLLGTCNYSYSNTGFSSESYDGKNYYGLGLDYRYWRSENIEISLGIATTKNKKVLTYTQYPIIGGGGTMTSYYNEDFVMLSLPVHFKYHFLKYFFIGGGPNLNILPSIGAGVEINAGIEYNIFKSGLTVSVTPRWQLNWLYISSEGNSFIVGMDRLSQIGVNIGLGYRFGK